MDLVRKVESCRLTAVMLHSSGRIGEVIVGRPNVGSDTSRLPVNLKAVYTVFDGIRSGRLVIYGAAEIDREFRSRLKYSEDEDEEDPVPLVWREIGFMSGGRLLYCNADIGCVGVLREEEYSSESIDPLVPQIVAHSPEDFLETCVFGSGYIELAQVGSNTRNRELLDQDWLAVLEACGLVES